MTETPDDLGGAAGPPVEELTYTEASRELDEIVHFFEQREVDVDQLVGRLVRATSLVEELDKRLRQTRMQVEQLVPRLAAVLSDSPAPRPGSVVAARSDERQGGVQAEGDTGREDDEDLADLDEEDLEEVELAEAETPFFEDGDAGSTPELF